MHIKIIVVLLIGLALVSVHPAYAQQPKKVHRIGYLSASDPATESTRSEGIRLALWSKDGISPSNTDMRREGSIGSLSLRPSWCA